jgi:DNA replication protein DnaC
LVHKLFILEARTFVGLSEPEFSILREKYSRQGTLEYWLNKCIAADVFFLDDIGHAASTARHMEELYHIIEKRTSWNKPIIATTQFTLQDIEDKSGKSSTTKTAMAILNRLLSFCDKVQF